MICDFGLTAICFLIALGLGVTAENFMYRNTR